MSNQMTKGINRRERSERYADVASGHLGLARVHPDQGRAGEGGHALASPADRGDRGARPELEDDQAADALQPRRECPLWASATEESQEPS